MNDQTTTPSHVSDQETPSIPRGRARRLMAEIIAGDLQIDSKAADWAQQEERRLDVALPPPVETAPQPRGRF